MNADQPPPDPLDNSRATTNSTRRESAEDANAWLRSLSVFNPVDHIKLISFVLRGQLFKLNLSKRYQVQSDLNQILPWTLAIISWGSILIASLVTDQLVGLNTQTRYSGLAIWAFGFLISGSLGQQYNGAIQIIVSFLVSSLLQMKIVRWNNSLVFLAVTFIMRILEFGFQLSVGLHFSRDFAFYLRHLLTPLMTLVSLYFTIFAYYIQYDEAKHVISMVTLATSSVVLTLMGYLYLTRVKKAATYAKSQRHKFQLITLGLVPYGVAALFNWVFYLPFEEELIHEVLTTENFYSILCLGSAFLCIIYTIKETKEVGHRLVHAVFNPLFIFGYIPLLATSVYIMLPKQ